MVASAALFFLTTLYREVTMTRIEWFIAETSKFPVWGQTLVWCAVGAMIVLTMKAISNFAHNAPVSLLDSDNSYPAGWDN